MIFKRDLAANGVTQLEAIFSSIISTFSPAPSCSPLPLREDRGCPAGARLEQNFFQANFLFCPNKASYGNIASLVCECTSGLLGLSVIWGTNCNGWGCGELQRRGPHNSLLVTCLTYVRSPVCVSLDLIYSFPKFELPLSPLFSLLWV